jgi:ribosome-binding factor A
MSRRIQKINELIRQEIAKILSRELELKSGIFLTVAKVDTTRDLRYTRIFVSVFPEKEAAYVMETLKKEIYKIQGKINKQLNLKPLPRVEFKLDTSESKADEIEKILKEINNR